MLPPLQLPTVGIRCLCPASVCPPAYTPVRLSSATIFRRTLATARSRPATSRCARTRHGRGGRTGRAHRRHGHDRLRRRRRFRLCHSHLDTFGFGNITFDANRLKSMRGRVHARTSFTGAIAPFIEARGFHQFRGDTSYMLSSGANSTTLEGPGRALGFGSEAAWAAAPEVARCSALGLIWATLAATSQGRFPLLGLRAEAMFRLEGTMLCSHAASTTRDAPLRL